VSAVATAGAPPQEEPRIRKKRRRVTSYFLPTFTGVVIFYLASPVFLMILYSFNVLHNQAQPRQSARFVCCTVQWWTEIFDITELNQALLTSIKIAIPAALIATILGTLIGIVLGRYAFRGRAMTNFVIFLAIAVPEIVLGSALLAMFVGINLVIPLGYWSILLSHIGFSIAFVAVVVRARVQGLDGALESAAQDLYATPPQAFFKVTLPLILPGIVGGFLLAFVLSLDDFVITNFVNGKVNTFPTWVYGAVKLGLPPHVNVWGTVLFSVGILVAAANLLGARRASRKALAG
jgi:spermidine/putrescine transport system permease protein